MRKHVVAAGLLIACTTFPARARTAEAQSPDRPRILSAFALTRQTTVPQRIIEIYGHERHVQPVSSAVRRRPMRG